MAIEVEQRVTPTRVHLVCTGVYTLRSLRDVLDQAFEAASRERLPVLIDGSQLEGRPTFVDRYDLGAYGAEKNVGRWARVAFIGVEPFVEEGRFAELVARNRWLDGRVFTDQREAIAWLESKLLD